MQGIPGIDHYNKENRMKSIEELAKMLNAPYDKIAANVKANPKQYDDWINSCSLS